MEMTAHLSPLAKSEQSFELERKIRDHSAKLGVLGLGYVGLPLAVEMAQNGFSVTGIDIDGSKVESVNAGISYVLDVRDESLRPAIRNGTIRATQSFAAVESLDTISICVPTPLRKTKDPDLSYIIASAEAIHNHLTPGKLIVLESTTYPGTTREVVLPILEKSGLKAGRDFFLAFSPERVDPGNKTYTTRNIPKVIGGITPRCTEIATFLYQQFVERTVPVSSPESAEMVKLLENTFRNVNIALANEMARMCRKFHINVWEVIDAAKTKPFGFMPFYPGPGLGGHCIPVDPYYLTWKARLNGFEPRLIEMATIINSQMPGFTVSRIADALNKYKKSLNGSHILAVGVAYKSDVSDTRESSALEVVKLLMEEGANVSYSDPYVSKIEIGGAILTSANLTSQLLQSMDCVVILTDHSVFDYSMIAADSPVVLDCRNALRDFAGSNILSL
ncbi:MAG TPA: nucleotide sugar dehydrogenase [Candidatus Binatia bacterium]|nr:nucleotide sugar dehydrogenase [Candidatus Binatia bacterium]